MLRGNGRGDLAQDLAGRCRPRSTDRRLIPRTAVKNLSSKLRIIAAKVISREYLSSSAHFSQRRVAGLHSPVPPVRASAVPPWLTPIILVRDNHQDIFESLPFARCASGSPSELTHPLIRPSHSLFGLEKFPASCLGNSITNVLSCRGFSRRQPRRCLCFPNNSLYFPAEQGIRVWRRVRDGLPAQPANLLKSQSFHAGRCSQNNADVSAA